MTNKIYHGDCLRLMNGIGDGSIDMILCDLPYGITQNKWDSVIPLTDLWQHYERIIKPNGAIVLFGAGKFSARLMLSNEKLHRYNLIWEKPNATGFLNAKKMPMRCHEDIMVFYKSLPTYNPIKTTGHPRKVISEKSKRNSKHSTNYGKYVDNAITYDSTERYPRSVLKFSSDKQISTLHPTQKPVALFEYLIKTYTNEGDVVLDNCSGSGTTAIAALRANRRFICMESDKDIYDASVRRLAEFDPDDCRETGNVE